MRNDDRVLRSEHDRDRRPSLCVPNLDGAPSSFPPTIAPFVFAHFHSVPFDIPFHPRPIIYIIYKRGNKNNSRNEQWIILSLLVVVTTNKLHSHITHHSGKGIRHWTQRIGACKFGSFGTASGSLHRRHV